MPEQASVVVGRSNDITGYQPCTVERNCVSARCAQRPDANREVTRLLTYGCLGCLYRYL